MKTKRDTLEKLAKRLERARQEVLAISRQLEVFKDCDEACLQLSTASSWIESARTEVGLTMYRSPIGVPSNEP